MANKKKGNDFILSTKGGRQLIIDNDEIDLLGDRQGHLHLPNNLVKIFSSFTRRKSSSNSKTNTAYFQDKEISRDGSRGRQLPNPGVGREWRLEDPPQPPRRKTPDKGKLKATLPTLSCLKTVIRDLRKKIIAAKNAELEKFFKFNVIKSVPRSPRGSEVMRTTWVITEKSDNMSKTGSKIKARLCTMGNSAKEFSKDSVQYESPTCNNVAIQTSIISSTSFCT